MSQDYAAPAGVYEADDVVDAPATPPYSLATRMAAEAFGTFILVLGIVGTGTFNFLNLNGTILTVALSGGIMLMAAFASVGHVSGGHFNPAVTFGTALAGRSAWKDLLPYWAAQLLGGTVAAAALWAVVPAGLVTAMGLTTRGDVLARTANGWGASSQLAGLTQGQAEFPFLTALLVEVIVAAVFVGVFLAVTGKRARLANPAVVVGLTLGALYIVAWPVTNASINPARSFASVVFAGSGTAWGQLWLFFVAPLVGAGLAALFTLVFAPAVADASDEVIDEIEETYEIVPAATAPVESADSVASAESAESIDSAESVESVESAESPEPVEQPVADDVETTSADDIAAPEGSTPDKPQA
ncbi:major intrinsic protein [Xylanimonas cellulosilytica DSM 15894]|uniref:Major intrinsic protein n=1 Tax=Xylanimonas cellulosilytica (strain DSM 15894 / JCM 12276 / CECT 5975 / KCTC 9989 / LMG 20990 / NBRC 107835 / XIL07) TaxID=446471 RepID=D1BXH0_XYLCX|nr:aquaporin [Xylanimonas cellulosilytica]ACZ29780.1 major intrinsic protein [Xylanimonas cellulosilytica DSM 15894]